MSAVKPATVTLEKINLFKLTAHKQHKMAAQEKAIVTRHNLVLCLNQKEPKGSITSATENKLLDIEGYRNRKYPRPKWVAIE